MGEGGQGLIPAPASRLIYTVSRVNLQVSVTQRVTVREKGYLLLRRRLSQLITVTKIVDFNIFHPISVLLINISKRSTFIFFNYYTD